MFLFLPEEFRPLEVYACLSAEMLRNPAKRPKIYAVRRSSPFKTNYFRLLTPAFSQGIMSRNESLPDHYCYCAGHAPDNKHRYVHIPMLWRGGKIK